LNAVDPLTAALKLLSGRDHSTWELAAKLRRKGFTEADIAATLDRCRELGYLDDRRVARNRARNLMSSGRAVGARLLLELKKAGIDETRADQAVADAEAEIDRDQLLKNLLKKRFNGFVYDEADDRQRRRVVHYFLRRGFALNRILALCRAREF